MRLATEHGLFSRGAPWFNDDENLSFAVDAVTKVKAAVLDSQRMDGAHRGSWDPLGPWGHSGGRVYSTALMVLNLEVYFRYGQLIGAR